MPTITLSVSLGELLLAAAACALGILFFRRCRTARQTDGSSVRILHSDAMLERGDLVSKLAVAVSMIVTHAEACSVRENERGAQLLDALRESSLALVESVWVHDLERAYEDSKNRRIAAYKQSESVAELREKIKAEDRRLREEIEVVNSRLEDVLHSSRGRYARASSKLGSLLDRLLH